MLRGAGCKNIVAMDDFIPARKPIFNPYNQRKPVHRNFDNSKDKLLYVTKICKIILLLNDIPDSRCETSKNKQFVGFEKMIFM